MIKIFESVVEWIGWLRVMVSPLLIGPIAGIIVYYFMSDKWGLIIGGILMLGGLTIGISWATKIMKTQGTNQFLSRIIATPDLDDKKQAENQNGKDKSFK